jgi:hypothetical protein
MRIKLIWVILASGTVLALAPSHAQTYDPNYPVCMEAVSKDGGTYIDCSFTSMPQCQATASGRAAQCLINPYFARVDNEPSRKAYRRQLH